MKKVCILGAAAILLVSLTAVVSAEQKKRVSVLPFGYSEGIAKAEAKTLTDLFETALIKTQVFDVIERTEADTVLRAQEYAAGDCTDETCAVKVGQLLAADHIFLGSLSTLGAKVILSVKLIDIEKGRSLKAESAEAGSLEKLSVEILTLANLLSSGESVGGQGRVEMVEEKPSEKPGTEKAGAGAPAMSTIIFSSEPEEVHFRVLDSGGRSLFEGITPKSVRLSTASYSVEAQDDAGLYHVFREKLAVGGGTRMNYRIQLKPNFGGVTIRTDPDGADVLMNGMRVGTTPFSQERLKVGSYEFVLRKELYESKALSARVTDGQTTELSERLTPAFVWLSVVEKNGLSARAFANDKELGGLPLRVRITYKDFTLRVTPEDARYKPYEESVSVRARGEDIQRSVALAGRTGRLFIDTDPFVDGKVFVDGKEVGATQDEYAFLAGEVEVKATGLFKNQLFSGSARVLIEEGAAKTITLKMTLDEYQRVIEGWNAELDALLAAIKAGDEILISTVERAEEIADQISCAEFALPQLKERSSQVLGAVRAQAQRQSRKADLAFLEMELEYCRQEIASTKKTSKPFSDGGFVGGAFLGALAGVFYLVGETAYTDYKSQASASGAVNARSKVLVFDALRVGCTAGSALSLIVGLAFSDAGAPVQTLRTREKALLSRIESTKAQE
jgi:TolB-like protein